MTLTFDQHVARDMSEDTLLTYVLDILEVHGFLRSHVRNSRAGITQGNVGLPDVLAVGHGRILAIELKREGKDPTPEQLAWLEAFRDAGAESFVFQPHHYLTGRIGAVLGGQK